MEKFYGEKRLRKPNQNCLFKHIFDTNLSKVFPSLFFSSSHWNPNIVDFECPLPSFQCCASNKNEKKMEDKIIGSKEKRPEKYFHLAARNISRVLKMPQIILQFGACAMCVPDQAFFKWTFFSYVLLGMGCVSLSQQKQQSYGTSNTNLFYLVIAHFLRCMECRIQTKSKLAHCFCLRGLNKMKSDTVA